MELISNSERDFLNWLAGFIDGEGCFQIKAVGKQMCCEFNIRIRDDDASVLHDIVRITKIGHVTTDRAQRNVQGYISHPLMIWKVSRKKFCIDLIELLEKHPMRAKKVKDFQHWSTAVKAWSSVSLKNKPDQNQVYYDIMRAEKIKLEQGRKYQGLKVDINDLKYDYFKSKNV